jgi:hypothetical protein
MDQMGIVGGPAYPQRELGSRIVNLPLEKKRMASLVIARQHFGFMRQGQPSQ